MAFKDKAALALATWFGAGYFPFASGTLATALALPLVLLLAWAAGLHGLESARWNGWNLAAAALLTWPGIWSAGRAEKLTGERDSHKIVVDEVAGTFLTLAFLPLGAFQCLGTYAWAFLVFRILDVAKPFPIRQSQVLPGGWGVMVDDLLAGLAGGLVLMLVWKFLPGWMDWGRLAATFSRGEVLL